MCDLSTPTTRDWICVLKVEAPSLNHWTTREVLVSFLPVGALGGKPEYQQYLFILSESESVSQLFLTLCDPMDCSLPGPSVHGMSQARILEWVAIPSFSRGSSWPRDWTRVSCIVCVCGGGAVRGCRILYYLSHQGSLFIFFTLFKDFFFPLLGLPCCPGLSLVVLSGDYSSLLCKGFSLRWLLLLWNTGSRCTGSVVMGHGLSCSTACGIFLAWVSNPCPQHWQADSKQPDHQGSPILFTLCSSNLQDRGASPFSKQGN